MIKTTIKLITEMLLCIFTYSLKMMKNVVEWNNTRCSKINLNFLTYLGWGHTRNKKYTVAALLSFNLLCLFFQLFISIFHFLLPCIPTSCIPVYTCPLSLCSLLNLVSHLSSAFLSLMLSDSTHSPFSYALSALSMRMSYFSPAPCLVFSTAPSPLFPPNSSLT